MRSFPYEPQEQTGSKTSRSSDHAAPQLLFLSLLPEQLINLPLFVHCQATSRHFRFSIQGTRQSWKINIGRLCVETHQFIHWKPKFPLHDRVRHFKLSRRPEGGGTPPGRFQAPVFEAATVKVYSRDALNVHRSIFVRPAIFLRADSLARAPPAWRF